MARHIVCVLDRTVGHVSFCWDYVSTFLCNKNRLLYMRHNYVFNNTTNTSYIVNQCDLCIVDEVTDL